MRMTSAKSLVKLNVMAALSSFSAALAYSIIAERRARF